ncbi:hypothetical protein NV379_00940 [Paenibacillus sp. N1-5-1-14]|nr:hypothetical protein [Paenibacillus radicibacter]MCR8641209.1 hypothetical protein [Paenibacillus radicibacter]
MEKMMASHQAEMEKEDRQGLWRNLFKNTVKMESNQDASKTKNVAS